MKKVLLTLATLFSSHVFAAGNIQAMQGRFSVNTSRCNSFHRNTPSRAFISARSADSLLVEFLGSEGRELVVHIENGEDMGRNGRESYKAVWSGANKVTSSRTFINDDGATSKEIITMEVSGKLVTLEQSIDGRDTMSCELLRNR